MKIIFSEKCMGYFFPGHPETPERVGDVYRFLKKRNFDFVEPGICSESDLLKVHSKEHVEKIRSGNFHDPETPSLPGIYNIARLSAGGAIRAMEISLGGEPAFSLMRPPGHHASRASSEGFCYFNNIAVATSKALEKIKRAAIIDIDAHHGQGTQEIFMNNPRVVYASLHQAGIYPGTGLFSENNAHNFPLRPCTGEEEYLESLGGALETIRKFRPDILGISAGFDTCRQDPLANMNLEIMTYRKIAKMISEVDAGKFAVLEGGYSKQLPHCIFSFLKAF